MASPRASRLRAARAGPAALQRLDGASRREPALGHVPPAPARLQIWDAFMDSIEPFARRIPYMVGTGNHEYDYLREAGCRLDTGC